MIIQAKEIEEKRNYPNINKLKTFNEEKPRLLISQKTNKENKWFEIVWTEI